MEIEGDSITQACQSKTKCNVNNNLCGSELNIVLEQLDYSKKNNKNLLIACTQEQQTFDKLAEDNNFESPKTFNIREYAGWSKESKKTTPKISALINTAVKKTKQTPSLTLESSGRCFVYVDYKKGINSLEIAADFCLKLSTYLGVTLMISNCEDDVFLEPKNYKITKGSIKKAQGYFTKFKLEINDFSEALPSSKSNLEFGDFFKEVDTGG